MLDQCPIRPVLGDLQGQINDSKLSRVKGLVTFGNETLDTIIGGGLVQSTVNVLECTNHHSTSMGQLIGLTFASTTLSKKGNLIIVVCDEVARLSEQEFLADLPLKTRVKSESLYKDMMSKTSSTRIKIAWRYTNLSSPSDRAQLVDQVDFGIQLNSDKELVDDIADSGSLKILHLADYNNINEAMVKLIELVDNIKTPNNKSQLPPKSGDRPNMAGGKSSRDGQVNILIMNLLSPFSLIDIVEIPHFMFTLRSLTRSRKNCTCLLNVYSELIVSSPFPAVLGRLYNLSDSVLKLSSFEDPSQTHYVDYDGILEIVKTGKINSISYHYDRDVCDWGFRRTKNNRYLVFDKLSLPPCDDLKSKEDSAEVGSFNQMNSQSSCSASKTNDLEF